jgi:YegS/Rv2252/BmrU family lipid kinase
MKTAVIVNPNSSKLGRRLNDWTRIERGLVDIYGEIDTRFTERIGHASELARQAIIDGVPRIIAVGGDGTLSETVNGFFEDGKPLNREVIFSFIMTGTGNDFQKSCAREKGLDAALTSLKNAKEKIIDVGRLEYIDHKGNPSSRYFLNIASFGMGGEVDRRVNTMPIKGVIGGKASFLLATIAALVGYRNKSVRLIIDDNEPLEQKIRLALVANGRFAGGGMCFAPEAALDDGLFDIIIMGDTGLLESVRNMSKIYDGSYLEADIVSHFRGKRLQAFSDEEVLLDIDGEAPGRLPATFEILPSVLRLQY